MFEITRYEPPKILVTSRRTGETYRFLVREDGTLVRDGTSYEQREACRAAVAYLAQLSQSRAA